MRPDQKKRLLLLLFLFGITGLGALWTTWNNRAKSSFKGNDISIAIQDSAAIKQIIIEKPNGDKYTVSQTSDYNWILNNEYKVRVQLVNYLKFGLQRIEVKRPVSKTEEASVAKLLQQKGTRCRVFIGNQIRDFLIMTNPNDLNSSYYLEQGHSASYIVYVPGVKGDLSNLLNLDKNDWRAKEIFTSTVGTLKSIQVIYTARKEDSFEIYYNKGGFEIKDVSNPDTIKIKKYLSVFNFLNADKFENLESLPTDLKTTTPDVVLKLEDFDSSKSNVLRIYFLKKVNKMIGLSDKTKEAMILNPQVFKFVLVNKKYFVAKKSTML